MDGGRSRSGFPSLFQTITQADGVDVVICTHNDADHVNGILGFIEAGLRCDEVWLPGRWLTVLPNVLEPLGNVVVGLAQEISEIKISANIEEARAGLSPPGCLSGGLCGSQK
ncbi:MAG: hypothetical protein ACYDDO_12095 [Acidiferrobacterales bacterium]